MRGAPFKQSQLGPGVSQRRDARTIAHSVACRTLGLARTSSGRAHAGDALPHTSSYAQGAPWQTLPSGKPSILEGRRCCVSYLRAGTPLSGGPMRGAPG